MIADFAAAAERSRNDAIQLRYPQYQAYLTAKANYLDQIALTTNSAKNNDG